MLNVYVLLGAKTTRASGNTSAEGSDSGKLLVGRLALADQQRIFVNGNEAPTGTSIFSGMRLQSPLGVNAVVQLGELGQVSLEPSTDLTLDFSNGHVAVTVASGEATLTTNDGVEGTLTAADGNVMKSEGTKASVLSTSARASAAKMSGKRKAAWIIIPVVAVIIIIAIVVADDDNNSPA
jgi:hypothetical protein